MYGYVKVNYDKLFAVIEPSSKASLFQLLYCSNKTNTSLNLILFIFLYFSYLTFTSRKHPIFA